MVCNELVEGDIQAHFQEHHPQPKPSPKRTTGPWQEELLKVSSTLRAITQRDDGWKGRVKQLDEVILTLYEIRVMMTEER